MTVRTFEIALPEATLGDLRARLARARLAPDTSADWDAGVNPAYLAELVEYWRSRYDFRRQEAALNRLPHFQADVAGTTLHFLHARGRGDAPMPLLLTHGFPDSFLRFVKLIPLLTDPAAHGGDPSDAFDVVVPSLPGYGFSQPLAKPGSAFRFGDLLHELMTKQLGYERFAAHGGDWGSTVTDHLARSHHEAVIAIHLTEVPFWRAFQKPRDAGAAELEYLAGIADYFEREGAYALIQGTRPQTLADSLIDSPVGLAAWIIDHDSWTYRQIARVFDGAAEGLTRDDILDNITLYWLTNTGVSSARLYWENKLAFFAPKGVKIPVVVSAFPEEICPIPRKWAEKAYPKLLYYKRHPKGAHFAAWEQPQAIVEDLRAGFKSLRS